MALKVKVISTGVGEDQLTIELNNFLTDNGFSISNMLVRAFGNGKAKGLVLFYDDLGAPVTDASGGGGGGTIPEDLPWSKTVITRYDPTSALPVGPITLDRYLATATANGWTDDYLYEWSGTAWDEIIPEDGFTVYVVDENVYYAYTEPSNIWVKVGTLLDHGNLLGLADDDHPQYKNTVTVGASGAQFTVFKDAVDLLNANGGGEILLIDPQTAFGSSDLDLSKISLRSGGPATAIAWLTFDGTGHVLGTYLHTRSVGITLLGTAANDSYIIEDTGGGLWYCEGYSVNSLASSANTGHSFYSNNDGGSYSLLLCDASTIDTGVPTSATFRFMATGTTTLSIIAMDQSLVNGDYANLTSFSIDSAVHIGPLLTPGPPPATASLASKAESTLVDPPVLTETDVQATLVALSVLSSGTAPTNTNRRWWNTNDYRWYNYDPSRSKWLSENDYEFVFALTGPNSNDVFLNLTGVGSSTNLSYAIPASLTLVEATLSQDNSSVAGSSSDTSGVNILRTAATLASVSVDDGDYHGHDDTLNVNFDSVDSNVIGIRAQLTGQGGGGARMENPVLTLRFRRRG